MDKLSQISIENTVTLKVDCILNQEILAKNFGIIMNCLKDLKDQQDRHQSELNGLANLKEMFDKFSEFNNKEKGDQDNSNETGNQNQRTKSMQSLQKQIQALKSRMSKNEGFTNENTKDINLQRMSLIEAKEDIEALKKLLNSIDLSNNTNNSGSSKNLSRNQNLNQQSINNLNQQSRQYESRIQRLEKQMDNMKELLKKVNSEVDALKDNQQLAVDTDRKEGGQDSNVDSKSVSQMLKKIQYLNKKTQSLQNQANSHSRDITNLNENTQNNTQSIGQMKQNIQNIHQQLQEVNKMLQMLKKVQNNENNGSNGNLLQQMQRLKEMYDKLLKMVNSLKDSNGPSNHKVSENSPQIEKDSNKNIGKASNDRSFRRRSESVDINGKVRQLTERIRILQKLVGQDNPERLPSIAVKKLNQTSYNGEKSLKKELMEMKNQIEVWVKAYLNNAGKNNGSLHEFELKIQQLKTSLNKKADHEGMKKGLAFLQGKITQLYLFLTQPDAQDAMIVRKGFNCLSCSKKVESLRGKLGPRMNWDNLNTNNQNHTPSKVGFPKYADSNQKQSI